MTPSKAPETPQEASPASAPAGPRHLSTVYIAALALAIVLSYWTLTKYFFAQDDFRLIADAAFDPVGSITDFFDRAPGHFRPLSKGAYFVVTFRVFGMHATPYHLLSLLIHLCNVVLTWRLLRRCGVGELAALAGVTLFGLSVSWFHVIGWISCVQQLLGLMFLLVAVEFALRAISSSSLRDRWISVGSYVCALASAEQTVFTPFIIVLFALLNPTKRGSRTTIRNVLAATVEHWALLFVFASYMLFWKSVPTDGTYRFVTGPNIWVNLATYIGWSFDYLMTLTRKMTVSEASMGGGHVFFVVLVAYHAVRRRWRPLALGLGYFLLTILPTLFLVEHQFYLHTYIPAFGMIYLVALAIGDVFVLPAIRSSDFRYTILGVTLIVMTTLSFYGVRRNEKIKWNDDSDYLSSFVIRRAVAAGNAWKSLGAERDPTLITQNVILVYARPGQEEDARWNAMNVVEATGRGALVWLLYGRSDISVKYVFLSELAETDTTGAEVFFFDDVANFYAADKVGGR